MTVLVADDDPVVRRILTRLLTNAGHEVQTAEDGRALVELWKQRRHTVVVSDVEMPGKDGIEACREILKLGPEVTAVLMSGSPEAADRVDASGLGPCLRKPFPLADVMARVCRAAPPDERRRLGGGGRRVQGTPDRDEEILERDRLL